jgi:hypothetical protein
MNDWLSKRRAELEAEVNDIKAKMREAEAHGQTLAEEQQRVAQHHNGLMARLIAADAALAAFTESSSYWEEFNGTQQREVAPGNAPRAARNGNKRRA